METINSLNSYICNQLHATVTIHKDEGVTPMFISCPECNKRATSRMGQVDSVVKPTHEWYKPSDTELIDEVNQMVKDNPGSTVNDYLPGFKSHVSQGGLLMRKIK